MAGRADSIGLFWEDHKKVKKLAPPKVKREAPFPFWLSPDYLPGLAEAEGTVLEYITDDELLTLRTQQDHLHLDIEVYPNYVEVGIKSELTGKVLIFELFADPKAPKPNLQKLRWIIKHFCMITFNGRYYDIPMLAMFLACKSTIDMWAATEMIIVKKFPPRKVVKSYKVKWLPLEDQGDDSLWINQIDLKELTALGPGLKTCAGRLHAPTLQDLPFEPGTWLTPQQMTIVRIYNINDLDNTSLLYRSLSEQIKIRQQMGLEYRVDLRSLSDAQMAEAIIKKEITKRKHIPHIPRTIIDPGTIFKFTPVPYLKFQSRLMQWVLDEVYAARFVISEKGKIIMPQQLKHKIKIHNTVYKMGIGGLHSQEKHVAYESDDDYVIIDTDVTSYYPTLILNAGLTPDALGLDFLLVYDGIVVRRIGAKEAGDVIVAECLKIVVNGTFGKLGSKWSIMYAPPLMIQTTVGGQLSILMLCERTELAGIEVVSINTDGMVVKCKRTMIDNFKTIVKQWELDTGFKTEETRYKALYTNNVNNYIAVYEKSQKGKLVKTKGLYAETSSKKNAVNEIIINSIKELILNKTPIDHTIRSCTDIRQFTAMRYVKGGAVNVTKTTFNPVATDDEMRDVVMKDGWIFTEGEGWAASSFDEAMTLREAYQACSRVVEGEFLGKIARWYWATGEQKEIIYASNGNKVPTTDGARACMNLPKEFPTDIDYDHYINEANQALVNIGYIDGETTEDDAEDEETEDEESV